MTKEEYTASLVDYLQRSNPDVWHQIALGWNWDGGVAVLSWIIRQPQCDRGTALLIYWRGGPSFMKQYATRADVPPYLSVELYDLIEEIEERYISGVYTRREIGFNPRKDDGYDWTTRYADVSMKRKIPEPLFAATLGREVLKSCVYLHPGSIC